MRGASVSSTKPIGTLISRIQRHDSVCVRIPPNSAPEVPPAPQPEAGGDEDADEAPESSGEVVFHDFAAEAGLVDTVVGEIDIPDAAEEPPAETQVAEPEPEPSAEAPAPPSEDTQVHDMERELGRVDEEEAEGATAPAAPSEPDTGPEAEIGDFEVDESDLDIDIEDEEIELGAEEIEAAETSPDAGANGSGEPAEPEGSVEVVEESDVEVLEPEGEEPEDGEDVLEETPEFLRDTPESDRLWFEQGKPKDFDFDEDE